jgi:subtilase family protein/flagellar hook capping protein FlgD
MRRTPFIVALVAIVAVQASAPEHAFSELARRKMHPTLITQLEPDAAAKPTVQNNLVWVMFKVTREDLLPVFSERIVSFGGRNIRTFTIGDIVTAWVPVDSLDYAICAMYDDIVIVLPALIESRPEPLPAPRASRRAVVDTSKLLDESILQIGADVMWEHGYRGQGVRVGINDSGYDREHPDLQGRVVHEREVVPDTFWYVSGDSIRFTVTQANADGDSSTAWDFDGHGTAMTGIVGAAGGKLGVAPAADLVVSQINGRLWNTAPVAPFWAIAGANWMIDPNQDGDTSDRLVDVMNASHGATSSYASDVADAGVVLVSSSGNYGEMRYSVYDDRLRPMSITVGAILDDNLWWEGSTGYIYNEFTCLNFHRGREFSRMEPDVVAPCQTWLLSIGGGYTDRYISEPYGGTSSAAAYTSGAIALLLSANPELIGRPDLVKIVVEKTARHRDLDGNPSASNKNHRYGSGIIDASRFLPDSVQRVLKNWAGDVDDDLKVTLKDVQRILSRTVRRGTIASGVELYRSHGDTVVRGGWLVEPHPFLNWLYADITRDGTISALDASWVLRRALDSTLVMPTEGFPPPLARRAALRDTMRLGAVVALPDSTFAIPLIVGTHSAYGIQVSISYDSTVVVPDASAFLMGIAGDSVERAVDYFVRSGTAYASIAFTEPIRLLMEADTLVRFAFRVRSGVSVGTVTHMRVLQNTEVFPTRSSCDERETLYWGLGKVTVGDITSVADVNTPAKFQINQNIPNPFNPSTSIRFDLPRDDMVSAHIYNTLGQQIRTLTNQPFPAGIHRLTWDGRDSCGRSSASGVYILRMRTGNETRSIRLTLVR